MKTVLQYCKENNVRLDDAAATLASEFVKGKTDMLAGDICGFVEDLILGGKTSDEIENLLASAYPATQKRFWLDGDMGPDENEPFSLVTRDELAQMSKDAEEDDSEAQDLARAWKVELSRLRWYDENEAAALHLARGGR